MIFEQQAEVARAMTGSKTDINLINQQVNSVISARAGVIFFKIDALVKEHNLSFDQAFPIIKMEFIKLAENECLDPASIFCIYMNEKSNR
jgi:hypothetical protein